jgi:peptide deformylase
MDKPIEKVNPCIKDIVTDRTELSKVCSTIKTLHNNSVLDNICMCLIDTYRANIDKCVGLSANQIGFKKRVILVRMKKGFVIMINPEFKPSIMHGSIQKKETCLSFPGIVTKVKRYKRIKVTYDPYSKEPVDRLTHTYTKIEARIVQHEVDHLDGVLI